MSKFPVRNLLMPVSIVEGSDRDSKFEHVRYSQMHLVIWAAFRNLHLFSFSLELLITGALWKQLVLPAPCFPLAPSSCCCRASCWAVVAEPMLGW